MGTERNDGGGVFQGSEEKGRLLVCRDERFEGAGVGFGVQVSSARAKYLLPF